MTPYLGVFEMENVLGYIDL